MPSSLLARSACRISAVAAVLIALQPAARGQEIIIPPAAPESPPSASAARNVWKQAYDNILSDQKDVLRAPSHLRDRWVPFVALAAATAGLVALDPADTPAFRRTEAFHTFNTVASGFNTGAAMAAVPALFYLTRSAAHDSYGKLTAIAAAEAIADVQILTFAAKMIDRRIRPSDIPPSGNYGDTWFKASALGGKSFPSGHTITAFALARVFAARYPDRRWVPWVAYGLAATVGFSRVTLQSHFPSDVFAGGALGIVVTDGFVLPRWR